MRIVIGADNVPVYKFQILFDPSRKPDPVECILWKNYVYLTDPDCFIHGQFNYNTYSDVTISN